MNALAPGRCPRSTAVEAMPGHCLPYTLPVAVWRGRRLASIAAPWLRLGWVDEVRGAAQTQG